MADEPAPREYSLTRSREMLELLYGNALERLPELSGGICADCEHESMALLAYTPKLALCRSCALSRRRVALKLVNERDA